MKAEKWQFEYENLYDKYDALQKEKEVSWRTLSGKRRFSRKEGRLSASAVRLSEHPVRAEALTVRGPRRTQ